MMKLSSERSIMMIIGDNWKSVFRLLWKRNQRDNQWENQQLVHSMSNKILLIEN